ncbi:MAG: hypothetical protein ACRCY3_13940 [Sphingorhabdus sp.]
MNRVKRGAVFAAVTLSIVATPAQACWNNAEQDAARIANLNQKLMVSGLRCRFGKDNFLNDYNRFVTRNNALLASQHALIKGRYARASGAGAANAELDRFIIGLSNYYGGGHGNPDCAALKSLAAHLSSTHLDSVSLARLADENAGVPYQAQRSCTVAIATRQ